MVPPKKRTTAPQLGVFSIFRVARKQGFSALIFQFLLKFKRDVQQISDGKSR
jgi:hypothetical protein